MVMSILASVVAASQIVFEVFAAVFSEKCFHIYTDLSAIGTCDPMVRII